MLLLMVGTNPQEGFLIGSKLMEKIYLMTPDFACDLIFTNFQTIMCQTPPITF